MRTNVTLIVVLGLLVILSFHPELLRLHDMPNIPGLHTFKTMLISILLEAIPFLLLGVIVSSLLHVFVPEQWIKRLVPKNALAGVLIASLLGILFPVCECGLIPVVRRLIAKGMPLYAGVAFFLAGPIVNPIVYSATYVAFRTKPELLYARMGLALAVAACIGLLVYWLVKSSPLKSPSPDHGAHQHEHSTSTKPSLAQKLHEVAKHGGGEFFDMGKYLILGSLLTAIIQAYVPRSELLGIGQGELSSHVFMMGFAFILSLCSTADAFVAASFMSTFSAGSLLTFMVFGPMIDLKGTLMLLSAFRAKFVFFIIGLVAVLVPTGAWLLHAFYLS